MIKTAAFPVAGKGSRLRPATQSVPKELLPVAPGEAKDYGILDADIPDVGCQTPVRDMVEKPAPGRAPSNLAVVGRYILHPSIFAALHATSAGSGGEIQLTDAIKADLAKTGVAAFRFDGVRYDCGQADGLLAAGLAMQAATSASAHGAAA